MRTEIRRAEIGSKSMGEPVFNGEKMLAMKIALHHRGSLCYSKRMAEAADFHKVSGQISASLWLIL